VIGIQTFGNTPVPYTVAWTGEERFFVERCPYARAMAICQEVAPGQGKPTFGKPHMQRQRETIAKGLCDLCGKPLKSRTKVSLSHARTNMHGAEGPCVMQVEPLLHRDCAAICMRYCPSLRRDVAAGTLMVRQVTRYRVQFAIIGPEHVGLYVPGYIAKPSDRITGHAKVELIRWKDRSAEWLLDPAVKHENPHGMSPSGCTAQRDHL